MLKHLAVMVCEMADGSLECLADDSVNVCLDAARKTRAKGMLGQKKVKCGVVLQMGRLGPVYTFDVEREQRIAASEKAAEKAKAEAEAKAKEDASDEPKEKGGRGRKAGA